MASCVRTFPLSPSSPNLHSPSYEHLEVEYVTKYSTLLTLPGTNPSLPPVLLMSHQDTVPVQTATIGEWHHPPFEGRVTDPKDDPRGKRWIYGRGALDCKGLVTSELNALERIVKERLAAGRDIRGERTVVMSIGFDEEIMVSGRMQFGL